MKVLKKSFTLIELLIVIGILSILVVTILITLNPAEAQKKARDTKRLKDIVTLQAIVQQWINDGKAPFCTTAIGVCTSDASSTNVNSDPCNNNWLGQNLCDYTNSVPVDPANNKQRTGLTGGNPATQTYTFRYFFGMRGSDYEIATRLESISNVNAVTNDGGEDPDLVEVGSDLTIF